MTSTAHCCTLHRTHTHTTRTHALEPPTRNHRFTEDGPGDSGLDEVTCHGRDVAANARPASVSWPGRRVCPRTRRAVVAPSAGPSEDSGSNHTARTMGLASRFRAQKPLRTLAVSQSSALARPPCASCQSRVALQATPALPCNTALCTSTPPHCRLHSLPNSRYAYPFGPSRRANSPRALLEPCDRLATRGGSRSGPRHDEPPAARNPRSPSADAIVGRIQHPPRPSPCSLALSNQADRLRLID